MKISSTLTIGITGNVWDAVKGESLKTLVIAGGKITRIMDGGQNVPGATMINLDAGTVIFPGLINLHTHTTYNGLCDHLRDPGCGRRDIPHPGDDAAG